jgi:hypothetical protein
MKQKEIDNFVINIKASFAVNEFLYDYLDEHGYLDDIKEDNDPNEINVVGYNFKNDIITVSVVYFDECCGCGVGSEQFDIELKDFVNYLNNI